MLNLLKDLWKFFKVRKKFLLLPIIIVLIFTGILLVFAEGPVIAPFIYTLF